MKFITEAQNDTIWLWLDQSGDSVVLRGQDSRGICKAIFTFANGGFYRQRNAQLEGLKTVLDGKIIEEEEEE